MSNTESTPENNVKTIATKDRLLTLGIFFIVASAIGLLAAFELTYEKILWHYND
jgi:hypothetical protein